MDIDDELTNLKKELSTLYNKYRSEFSFKQLILHYLRGKESSPTNDEIQELLTNLGKRIVNLALRGHIKIKIEVI